MMDTIEEIYKHLKVSIMASILEEGITSGDFKKVNTEIYSDMFWALLDGVVLQQLLFPDTPFKSVIELQKKLFLNQILK